MNSKNKIIAISIAAVLMGTTLGVTGKAVADSYWAGHTNIVAINKNLDSLSDLIKQRNDTINQLSSDLSTAKQNQSSADAKVTDLQAQLKQQQDSYNKLASQRDADNQASAVKIQDLNNQLQKALQEKKEADDKVASITTQLNDANAKVKDLQKQVSELKGTNDYLKQAINDVQATKNKSDSVVSQAQHEGGQPVNSTSESNK